MVKITPPPPPPALRHKWRLGSLLKRAFLAQKQRAKNSVAPFNPLCGVANRQIAPRLFFSAESRKQRTGRHPLSAPTRGLGLIEVLVAGAIGSVIMIGSVKSLSFSLQASQVARAGLTELELRNTINLALGGGFSGSCGTNLNPKTGTLKGDNKAKGIGYVDRLLIDGQMPPAIQTGESFKGDLRIVKMALKGDESTDPKTSPQNRHFIVYYRKENLGAFSSIGQQKCQAKVGSQEEDLSGCYYSHCLLSYGLNTDEEVTRCQVMDCQSNTQVQFRPCGGNTFFYGFDSWDGTPICGPFPEDLVPKHTPYSEILPRVTDLRNTQSTQYHQHVYHGYYTGLNMLMIQGVSGGIGLLNILMGTTWNITAIAHEGKLLLGDLRTGGVTYQRTSVLFTQNGYTWPISLSRTYGGGIIHSDGEHIIDCMCSHKNDSLYNALEDCDFLWKKYNKKYINAGHKNVCVTGRNPPCKNFKVDDLDDHEYFDHKVLYMRQEGLKHKNRDFRPLNYQNAGMDAQNHTPPQYYPYALGYPDCHKKSQVFLSLPLPCKDGFFWNTNLCACERYPVSPLPPVPDCGNMTRREWHPYVWGIDGILAGVNKRSLYCVKLLTARLVDPNTYTLSTSENQVDNCERDWTTEQKSANRFVHEFCKYKNDPFPEDSAGKVTSACPAGKYFNLITCTCDPL